MKPKLLLVTGAALLAGCASAMPPGHVPSYGKLPGPAVDMLETIHDEPSGGHRVLRERGILDIRLSPTDRAFKIWNDPDTQKDLWGAITLKEIRGDGLVRIEFGGEDLEAKAGHVFPGTGLFLVDAEPAGGTIWIRTKWTRTVLREPTEPSTAPSSRAP